MTATIRPETTQDRSDIWNVNQAAFGGDDEANLVDALRDGSFVEVSLVAEVDGKIVGHILFSRISIIADEGIVDALSIAPMVVLPSHQRQGIGRWRQEERVQWWKDYDSEQLCIFGHYSNYRGETSLSGRAICADFAVAKRWQERKEPSFDGTFRGCLGAVRFPENCVVFDNGDTEKIGRIP
jgi:putative acetyltransferase